VMPFKDAIKQHIQSTFYPLKIIKENLSSFTSKNAESDYYNVKKLVNKTLSDMQSIKENCLKGMNLYEKNKKELITLMTAPTKTDIEIKRIKEICLKMNQPKQDCYKQYNHTFQLFFTHIIQSFNIKFEMEMVSIPEKHDCEYAAAAEISLRNSEWYKTIGELADITLELLVQTKGKLENIKPLSIASK
jgi:hypothetical protein